MKSLWRRGIIVHNFRKSLEPFSNDIGSVQVQYSQSVEAEAAAFTIIINNKKSNENDK